MTWVIFYGGEGMSGSAMIITGDRSITMLAHADGRLSVGAGTIYAFDAPAGEVL